MLAATLVAAPSATAVRACGPRANILNPSFSEVGIGVAIGAPGATGPAATYTTDFGSRG